MFKSIDYDNHHIDLVKDEEINIFSVDSFHLVIGKNGTGKTTFLKKIARAVVSPRLSFQDCRINVEDQARGHVAAIYYTSIPYKVDLPGNSTKFHNASNPVGKQPEKTVEIEQYIELSRQLGFNTKPICAFEVNVDFVIKRLADAIIESVSSYKHDQVFTHLLKKNRSHIGVSSLINIEDSSLAKRLSVPGETLISELRDPLAASLKIEIKKIFKDVYFKIFLAVVDKKLLGRRNPSLHIQGFIEKFILNNYSVNNIDVETSDLTPYEQDHYSSLKYEYRHLKDSIDHLRSYGLEHKETATRSVWEIPNNKILESIKEYSRGYIEFAWEDCSSGQLALMHQFSSIGNKIDLLSKKISSVLLLIDEGDIYLHLDWQKKYIKLLDAYLGNLIGSRRLTIHVILTTHSPILMSDVPKKYVLRLDRDDEIQNDHSLIKSFAASIDDIVNDTFETLPIGEFAKNLILKLLQKVDSKALIDEKDRFILDQIDNPVLRRDIEYQISKRNR